MMMVTGSPPPFNGMRSPLNQPFTTMSSALSRSDCVHTMTRAMMDFLPVVLGARNDRRSLPSAGTLNTPLRLFQPAGMFVIYVLVDAANTPTASPVWEGASKMLHA